MPKLRTNNDNDAFCASCGQKLGISVTPNPVPYNQEFYGAPDASVSGFAFVSLVLGIASILLCFVIPMLPIAIGIAGFVFGIISIKKSTKKTFPIVSTVTSFVAMIISIIFFIVCVVYLFRFGYFFMWFL